ncbi:SDR family NAD(P)-dependent oxidoreductase [Flavobacterium ranwuense]|uniref:SDR family NAD(P)-dependent oxidoreductase n=1 Tax=Flavobacterium ranwuense TaxID=2541725 RepID=A0ABY2DUQ5_9FLAO|nr:type I polyketide synthase [Flavobacterium ranwuense]TDE29423.1 SDR family NAD(P)-dependent oxidoreductase [Flavobacterium ranwuense]
MKNNNGIAVVGIDCRYPGADNLNQFWENILSLRQQFRRIPDSRLNLNYYGSDDATKVDYTYSKHAAVLTGYNFDRMKYKIAKSTFEQTDIAQWLTLDVVSGALKDAGFENGNGLNKEKVGVIIGNSLNAEFTRANILRLRWPYVYKTLQSTLNRLKYSDQDMNDILSAAEKEYKEPFPEPDADMLAGGLSNTIAGRVCNYFDFKGGGYTVDGACSSSLLAVVNGCNSIINNDIEVAIVGGVDLSIDPFELIGFARNGALAKSEMEVFSNKSQGFWPGEGCGILVLMKEEEAVKKGLNIYTVIKGWGISSDGKGGMTRPKIETQQLAMDRAYSKANYDISTISMFEAHGTGTPTGDEVEISAIVDKLKNSNKTNSPAILGSIKHLIGHTKAAAGVAGLIKAVLSSKNSIIPPSKKTSGIHALLEENSNFLKLIDKPQLWTDEQPFRAGISSFGFGGINVHITIEEFPKSTPIKKISSFTKKLATTPFDAEVFPLTSNNFESLLEKLQRLKSISRDISRAEMTDLSNNLTKTTKINGKWKASLVAKNPENLFKKVSFLLDNISKDKDLFFDINEGVFYSAIQDKIENAILFPGQGAPIYPNIGAFENVNFETNSNRASNLSNNSATVDTSFAQPHIIKSTLESLNLLENYGVEFEYGIGHSLGEIAALAWAGVINTNDAIDLAKIRGELMSKYGEKDGAMLAVKCNEFEIEDLISNSKIVITGYNGTDNFVVGGNSIHIGDIENKGFSKGFQTVRLKVSHAFHTPLMKKAAVKFKEQTTQIEFNKPLKKIISTVSAKYLDEKININQHLFEQIEKPVKFIQAINEIKKKVSFLFEIGPGNALSKSLIDDNDTHVISLNYGSNSLEGFLKILSAAFISGNQVAFEELSTNRFFRDFDFNTWELKALENPCEKVNHNGSYTIAETSVETSDSKEVNNNNNNVSVSNSVEGIITHIKKIISDKTDIPVEIITDNDKIMSQLHINSLAITEILSLTAKVFNKSHKVFSAASILANSDGSISELSKLIFEGETININSLDRKKINLDNLPNWTHTLIRKAIPKELTKINVNKKQGTILVEGKEELKNQLKLVLNNTNLNLGDGAVFVYSSDYGYSYLELFLNFLKRPEIKNLEFIALVDFTFNKIEGDLKPILRSFQQESPDVKTLSIDFNSEIKDFETLLIDEIKNCNKYKEVSYDVSKTRTESEVEIIFPKKNNANYPISEGDVILASGGGKGITFESVFEMAKVTNAKLAIFGRSNPNQDKALSDNLELLKRNNITYKYYSVNVLNKEDLNDCVVNIVKELGHIKAILHGAGVNNPNRIEFLSIKDFDKTFSVKVDGMKNIIDAVDAKQLNLVIGYGSIIAQSGMQGNADYAWANDQLALVIENFSKENSHCKCITLEWSVWDETGMGVNLNSIDILKGQGVWPIPIKNGVEILKAVISDDQCQNGRYIVSGRFGKIPTLVYSKRKPIIGRFIANITHHIPNIEVVSEVNINLEDDLYLKNHVFDGQYVFPTVMILEGMAQVAKYLYPTNENWKFEGLKINKSIFIPKEGNNSVRFIAIRLSEYKIKVIVQSEDSNFEVSCFEAELNFEAELIKKTDNKVTTWNSLEIDVPKKFYDDLLFHEGPFRRIVAFSEIKSLGALAQANNNIEDQWFSSFLSEEKILGDPGLNDAAIHCHQVSRPSQRLLPTSAKSISINPEKIEGPFYIKTTELFENGSNTTIDVIVFNAKGQVKQIWNELILTQVSGTSFKGEWDYNLLVPFLEYKLRHLINNSNIKIDLNDCRRLVNELSNGTTSSKMEYNDVIISFNSLLTNANSKNNGHKLLDSTNVLLSNSKTEYVINIYQEELNLIKN